MKFDFRSIQSFEDACKDQGKDPSALPDYSKAQLSDGEEKFNMAAFKIARVAVSINKDEEGKEWKPTCDDDRYYPWMWWKKDKNKPSGSGLSFGDTGCVNSFAYVASRLTCRDDNRAEYLFSQFKELFEDMIIFSD